MPDEVLDSLISEFHQHPLPDLVPRELDLPDAPRLAVTFIGMRRSGKTYAMFDVMRRLTDAGIPRDRMLYLNLEDERLGEPSVETLQNALELFYRRFPASRTDTSYLFLDEIQVVPGWERFARRVIDTENARVYLTGSSAKLLSIDVATAFRGRGFAVEVLPFGLRETAVARGVDLGTTWPPGAAGRSRAAALVDEYLEHGGFPDALRSSELGRVQLLHQYVELVLLKDVVERYGAENFVALRRLARALLTGNAGHFSVSRFHGALVSQGVKVAKHTLMAYLDHLADAYMVFLVSARTRSYRKRMVNPRKVYAVDPGLAAAMSVGGAQNTGALLEDFVYLELRRRRGRLAEDTIAYHRTASGFEVDFVVEPVLAREEPALIQVAASLEDPATKEREVRALSEAMDELDVRSSTVVTLARSERIETSTGVIRVVPAWEWALEPRGEASA